MKERCNAALMLMFHGLKPFDHTGSLFITYKEERDPSGVIQVENALLGQFLLRHDYRDNHDAIETMNKSESRQFP